MTLLTSVGVPRPLFGKDQPEVEQGMIAARHLSHVHPHLTVVDLPPVATPLPLHPYRVGTPLGEAAGVEGDDAIGCPEPIDHLSNQHRDQRLVVPWRRTDELLQDQTLDIDERRDFLSILTWQVRQQPLEVEVHIALAGCRLKSALIGHHEVAQALNHVLEDLGGNDAVLQQCLLPLCPRKRHLFASSHWHADTGCWLEAIDTPRGYVMQQGSEERHTVSLKVDKILVQL